MGLTSVKHPRIECGGFYRDCSLLASSRPVFGTISMEGSDPLSMSTIGTQTFLYASAFTQVNDLPWNPQTL